MNSSLINGILRRVAEKRRTPLWWVGGPVRDALMGRDWWDGDIVCDQAPRVARDIARQVRGSTLITLDEDRRIYRVICPGPPPLSLDVAQLAGGSIDRDLARRDFTINAMAREVGRETGPVIDPFHGQRDIQKRTVRALSKANLQDDPLRRLRAFRFASQLDFSVEPATRRWIAQTGGTLSAESSRVAGERVREELLKLCAGEAAAATFTAMDGAGLLAELLPELEACRRTAISFYGKGGVLRHSLNSLANLEWLLARLRDRKANPAASMSAERLNDYLSSRIGGHPRVAWMKLGALLHDIGKPGTAKRIGGRLRFFGHEELGADLVGPLGQRLRFSRQEAHLLRLWVKHHMRLGSLAAAGGATAKAHFRYLRDLGEDAVSMILISLADHYDYIPKTTWNRQRDKVEKLAWVLIQAQAEQSRTPAPKLISGHDVMRICRLKPSPEVGTILAMVEDLQAEGKLRSRNDAMTWLKKMSPGLRLPG